MCYEPKYPVLRQEIKIHRSIQSQTLPSMPLLPPDSKHIQFPEGEEELIGVSNTREKKVWCIGLSNNIPHFFRS